MQTVLDPRSPVPLSAQPRPPLLKALTSVRIFAALHVALYHLVRPHELWGAFAPVFRVGYVGVSFFFLLSGFILTYSHAAEYEGGHAKKGRFWMARFARIYPVYFFSLIVAGFVNRGQFAQKIHILAYLADFLMVQSWWVRLTPFFHTTAWSLSEEAFFYLIFPFAILRLRPRNSVHAWTSFFLLWFAAILVPVISLHFHPVPGWREVPRAVDHVKIYFLQRFPPLLLMQFLTGIALAWIFIRYRPAPKTASIFFVTGAVGLTVTLFCSDHLPFIVMHDGLLLPFFGLIILGLSESNVFSRALSLPFLVLLGESSYTLYLFHMFLVDWTPYPGGTSTIGSAFEKLALVIPFSIATHIFIERPCRRAVLEWWKTRSQHHRDVSALGGIH